MPAASNSIGFSLQPPVLSILHLLFIPYDVLFQKNNQEMRMTQPHIE